MKRPAADVLTLLVLPLVALPLLAGPAVAGTPPYGTSSNDTPAPCAPGTTACPTQDPFFLPGPGLGALADGALVAVRPAALPPALPAAAAAYTITYRSTDSFGAPVLDSGTVLLPKAPSALPGLVSWQFPEDSVGAQCRPSYDLGHPGTNANVDAEQGNLNAVLAQGTPVVAPDFQGPAETFEVGPVSGHGVLDGIRAALQLPAAHLAAGTPVALTGYSGGAFATGWGAELAGTYAPELHVVGAALGGTPADQAIVGHYLDGTAFAGLVLLTTIGLDRGFPALHVRDQLSPKGQAFADANQGSCVGSVGGSAFARLDDYTRTPDLIDSPAFAAALRFDDLGQRPPAVPVLSYHVVADEIVPYVQDQQLVKAYCAAGTPVQHVALAAGDHLSGEALGAPLVLSFLQARLQGLPFQSGCAAIQAAPLLPQVPPVTTASGPAPAPVVPEVGLPALLVLAGAGVLLVVRRRRAA